MASRDIQAIQWVQGVGDDEPIMQWVPLIQKIQAAGKGVIVDFKKIDEVEEFISAVRPEGLFLWIPEQDFEKQKRIIKRLERW